MPLLIKNIILHWRQSLQEDIGHSVPLMIDIAVDWRAIYECNSCWDIVQTFALALRAVSEIESYYLKQKLRLHFMSAACLVENVDISSEWQLIYVWFNVYVLTLYFGQSYKLVGKFAIYAFGYGKCLCFMWIYFSRHTWIRKLCRAE